MLPKADSPVENVPVIELAATMQGSRLNIQRKHACVSWQEIIEENVQEDWEAGKINRL